MQAFKDMQIFKLYFKIIKANMKQMSIYLMVFLSVAFMFSVTQKPKKVESFTQTKTNTAFINLGEDTALTKGLKEYLSQYATFVEVENQQDKLQDALFFRDVEYIVTVPKNFTEDFMQGKPVDIEKTIVPESTTRMYMDMALNKYFNTARVYLNNTPSLTEEQLVKEVAKSTSSEVKVNIKSFGEKKSDNAFATSYFNYLAYSLLAMLILGVTSNLMALNKLNVRRRNLCSPMKHRSYSLQLIAANLVFAFLCTAIMASFGFILNGKEMFSSNGVMLCINALVFTVAALSISYFIGMLIKSRGAQSALANTLSLGLSFLSGVFVPQKLLSSTTLTIASFNPAYWYVKANDEIGALTSMNFGNLSPILVSMLIELGFAAAIFSVSMVISKQKRIATS